jgi:transcriptional regulator with XRE-family HTH domain
MSALVNDPFVETLKQEFQDEDYRYAYQEEFANSRMATQIKVIREQRGLKQTELAELADMKQSRISALENVNYDSWSVSTLRRLARALGVTFDFGFKSWGELLPEIQGFGRKALEKPKFEDDPAFKDKPTETEVLELESFTVEVETPAPRLRLAMVNTATEAVQRTLTFDIPLLAVDNSKLSPAGPDRRSLSEATEATLLKVSAR